MLFKIFLYFLYIMNLSIYISVAYYLSKGYLAQVVSGWTPNLLVWGSNPLSSKQNGAVAGLTFVDPRWPRDISEKNRRFIAKWPIYREKSAISRDKCRNIAGPIFLQEISCRYPPTHDISAIYRRNIATFSSLVKTMQIIVPSY